MYTALYHSHKTFVILFILIYLIKTILLLSGNKESLKNFSSKIKIPEIIISAIFLISGVILLFLTSEIRAMFIGKLLVVIVAVPLAFIGFRKENKVMGFIAFFLIVSAYSLADMNKRIMLKRTDLPKEVITDVSSGEYDVLTHGKALFDSQCAACHGENGDLQMSGAKNLTVSVMTKEEIITRINEGKMTMVSYEHLSDEEKNALAEYILNFRE